MTQHVTQWFKHAGDLIVLLGETREELGASEYLALIHGRVAGAPPVLDLEREKRLQGLCLTAARERLFSSAHDVAEGGLAVALAEACISRPQGALGARVTVAAELRLWNESPTDVVMQADAGQPGPQADFFNRKSLRRRIGELDHSFSYDASLTRTQNSPAIRRASMNWSDSTGLRIYPSAPNS